MFSLITDVCQMVRATCGAQYSTIAEFCISPLRWENDWSLQRTTRALCRQRALLVSWRLQSFSHPLLPVLCAHCVWRLALVRIAQHHSGVPGLKISLNWKPYVTNTSKVLQHLISERQRVVSRWINFDDFDSMPMLTVIVASLQIATGELGLSIMLRLQCPDRLD